MDAKFVSLGNTVDHTPSGAVAAGDVVVVGSIVGIAQRPIDAGALGALTIAGVFDVAKKQEAFATPGAQVFWDADGDAYGNTTTGTGAATATGTGNTFMGYILEAAAELDTTVRVVLRSAFLAGTENLGLADLSDVGTMTYTGGKILVADGSKYEDVAVSGDGTLSSAGVLAITSFATMPTIPVAAVAAAGSVQGDAAAVATGFTHATGADATKGVKLPAAAAGKVCIIKNADAANAVLKIWPATDDAINAIASNAALSIAAKTSVMLVALDATTWYTLPLLPS